MKMNFLHILSSLRRDGIEGRDREISSRLFSQQIASHSTRQLRRACRHPTVPTMLQTAKVKTEEERKNKREIRADN